MKKGIRIGVLAAVAALALALVAAATAAYTTPTLRVSQAGPKTTISVVQAQTDDATARAVISMPAGIQTTLTQAPGTTLGPVKAQVTALALAGALLPLEGSIVVAAPGQVAAASQQACIGAATPTATWLMVLTAVGQTLNVPMYVTPTAITVCLPPPDIPVASGGATFGAKLINAEFSVSGVFGPSPLLPWTAIWTPYQAGNGQVNAAGSVGTPAIVAPGALAAKLTKKGLRTTVAGQVSQAAQALPGVKVGIFAGKTRAALKRIGTATTKAGGVYAFTTLNRGPFFRATVVVASRVAPQVCQAVAGQLPVPCVNGTVSGFTATSAVLRRP